MPLTGLEDITPLYGLNHYRVDEPYRLLLRWLLGREPDFSDLGSYAGREILEAAYRVDLYSPPHLVQWSYRGEPSEKAWLDPMERKVLEDLVWRFGVNRPPFQGGSWLEHYTGVYLVGDPGISCILTITVQTAYAVFKYGWGEWRRIYRGLAGIERPLLWGATWFTEIQGGSDLGANETVAEPAGERIYRLTGYKYFASGAGLADYALVSARPPGAPRRVKGLGLYLAPRLWDGKLNFRVRRLKWKSGTVAVPTGEVELLGSYAWELGGPGRGIYLLLEDLMVSRLANSVGALGIARKAYLEALLYALERRAFGRRVAEHPLAARDLLEMELELEAMTALALRAVKAFDEAWREEPPYTERYHLARLLTHAAKNATAEASAWITATAMELWGGIGFLREFHVERWHREAMITPIWEGTSNIQALDLVEAIVRKRAGESLLEDLKRSMKSAADGEAAEKAYRIVESAVKDAVTLQGARLEWEAKEILRRIARGSAVIYMLEAAEALGDELLAEAARLYLGWRVLGRGLEMPGEDTIRGIVTLRGSLGS